MKYSSAYKTGFYQDLRPCGYRPENRCCPPNPSPCCPPIPPQCEGKSENLIYFAVGFLLGSLERR